MRIVHLSRRRLLPALLLLLAALAAALFFALKKQSAPQTIYADGAAGCAAYLQKLGWEVYLAVLICSVPSWRQCLPLLLRELGFSILPKVPWKVAKVSINSPKDCIHQVPKRQS